MYSLLHPKSWDLPLLVITLRTVLASSVLVANVLHTVRVGYDQLTVRVPEWSLVYKQQIVFQLQYVLNVTK